MRVRNLLLLVFAVLLAGGTAMLARSYLAAQRVQQAVRVAPPPPPRPERSILVAHADISRGDFIKTGDLVWQVWPDNAIAKNYIVSGGKEMPQNFSGWAALDPIAAGEPITKAMLISPGNGGFLAAVLKPGMRAIQVPNADLPTGTLPGDRVDMMVNFGLQDPQKGWRGNNGVETVLRGLQILKIVGLQLEVGKPVEQRAPGAAPVIFSVTPKQAEIIALAERMGQLTFTLDSLRRSADEIASTGARAILAAARDPQPDAADPVATAVSAAAPAVVATASDPAEDDGEPSYMTDGEVNDFLRAPSREFKVPVTILRGATQASVQADLRCTETVCAEFSQMPTKLVGAGELAGVKQP
ncbi:MAG TPA: Flp pilus assembly protein CpaB [Stellaceae bacterium]|nr:Flp pilus assembly protein CpaB [Stellaceae bacterium]